MLLEILKEHITCGEIKLQDDEYSLQNTIEAIEKEAKSDFDCMVTQVTENDLIQDLAAAIVRRDRARVLAIVDGLEGYAESLLKEEIVSQINCNFEACHE